MFGMGGAGGMPFGAGFGMGQTINQDKAYIPDTSETVKISALALLKMLRHCKAGVPFEVMGIMLGEFVDEYTIEVRDVFSMPTVATTVSVESVDPVYQQKFMEMLKQVGRPEICVGWYHSHPGFGCWLSMVDLMTQKSFERMGARSVGFVLDPVQSVPGHVVMDCFRTIDSMDVAMANESRTTQSNTYYTKAKPSKEAQMRGVNKIYYNMCVDAKTDDPNEIEMLHKIRLNKWQQVFLVDESASAKTIESLKHLRDLTKTYKSQISVTESEDSELGKLKLVGKIDARAELKHLNEILI